VGGVPCGEKFTMTDFFGSNKTTSINMVAVIAWRILGGDSSSIGIHVLVDGLTHAI
jgi:hypothetical protein